MRQSRESRLPVRDFSIIAADLRVGADGSSACRDAGTIIGHTKCDRLTHGAMSAGVWGRWMGSDEGRAFIANLKQVTPADPRDASATYSRHVFRPVPVYCRGLRLLSKVNFPVGAAGLDLPGSGHSGAVDRRFLGRSV